MNQLMIRYAFNGAITFSLWKLKAAGGNIAATVAFNGAITFSLWKSVSVRTSRK